MTNLKEIIGYDKLTDFQKMVFDMMELQLQEDLLVHERRNTSYKEIIKNNGYFYALLDEFGEFNHELKPNWCWWKQNVGQVDHNKVVEEFSDITHFILSFSLALFDGDIVEAFEYYPDNEEDLIQEALEDEKLARCCFGFDGVIYDLIKQNPVAWIMTELLRITVEPDYSHLDFSSLWTSLYKQLGLDFETEVYQPYIKKNAINQKRVEEGY